MLHSEQFNPHQNININISYNLGNEKLSKSVLGKKILKSKKAQPSCDFIEIKLNKKENNIKRANEGRKANEAKRNYKKISSIHRNALTPDLVNDNHRKAKT